MVANRTREMRPSGMNGGRTETRTMAKAKRARTAETPKQPSLRLTLRAPYLYPDRAYSAWDVMCVRSQAPRRPIGMWRASSNILIGPRKWWRTVEALERTFDAAVTDARAVTPTRAA